MIALPLRPAGESAPPAPAGRAPLAVSLNSRAVPPPGRNAAVSTTNTASGKLDEEALPTAAERAPLARTADNLLPGVSFVPESLLTRRPQPLSPIDLNNPVPANLEHSGKIVADLYIDAAGRPVHFAVRRSDYDAAIEQDIARRFLAAHFRAGEINGMPVNATVAVVIELEAETARSHAPAVQSGN